MFNKIKWSLSTKLISVTAVFIAATVISAIGITSYFGNEYSQSSIDEKLSSGQSVQQEFIKQQAKQLELISLLVASDPAFVAYIAEAITVFESEDSTAILASITDILLERQQQFDFDVALMTTSSGLLIARSDKPMTVIKGVSSMPLLNQAMQQLETVNGFWQDQDKLYQAAIVPLARGRNLIGFFITGIEINNSTAGEIARLSGTEVLIVSQGKKTLKTIASSMDLTQSHEFIKHIKSHKTLQTQEHQVDQLQINQQKFAIKNNKLKQLGDQTIHLLASVSIDESLKPFVLTRSILIATGSLILLVALLTVYFLVKRTMLPIVNISQATRKIALGHLDARLPHGINQDLMVLNDSINQMVTKMRGKDSLSKHMVEMSKKLQPKGMEFIESSQSNEIIVPGKTIGSRYKIIKKIGSGGSGHVYKAFDLDLDELIVLKVLKRQNTKSREITLFKQEIRLARRILDPNIVRIHDYGQIDDHVFITMEYVKGYTIEEILQYTGKLRPHAAKHASIQICIGLMAAHDAGVIHRDLKPANLIVELDATVKLMDFGIATVQNLINKTQTHEEVEGTTAYLSPEQCEGKGADERSDIYALGILMMEMFVGQRPFKAVNDDELMLMSLTQAPTPISDYWVDAPILLEEIILKCLEKLPSHRYQSVQAVMNDLHNVEGV